MEPKRLIANRHLPRIVATTFAILLVNGADLAVGAFAPASGTVPFAFGAEAAPPKVCASVVRACKKAGYGARGTKQHKGKGLWSDCVRARSKGIVIPGLNSVSKQSALACVKARRQARKNSGV